MTQACAKMGRMPSVLISGIRVLPFFKVLDHPCIPLHNNDSERDIREAAKKRKISAGSRMLNAHCTSAGIKPASARSDAGRDARAAFLSLKKTCMKLNIRFWDYLLDRLHKRGQIPYLPEIILQNATGPP